MSPNDRRWIGEEGLYVPRPSIIRTIKGSERRARKEKEEDMRRKETEREGRRKKKKTLEG